MKNIILKLTFFVFCFLMLLLVVPGFSGNPTSADLLTERWRNGPFEYAQRARYGLTYSLIEEGRLDLSSDIANFSLPDIGYNNGKYVILFAPGTSFVLAPGYAIGKYFGSSQLGVFFEVIVFALANTCLVYVIGRKIGAKNGYAFLSAFLFLFATPVFFYSVNVYQHQITLFLLLSTLYLTMFFGGWFGGFAVFLMYGISVVVDYPNVVLLMPIVAYFLLKNIQFENVKEYFLVKIDWKKFLVVFAGVPAALFLIWFNSSLFANPFQLTATTQDVVNIDAQGQPVFTQDSQSDAVTLDEESASASDTQPQISDATGKTALGFFDTRNIIKGLSVHLIDSDRGIIFFAPVLLFVFFGLGVLQEKDKEQMSLIAILIGVNLILYSMWGDPWGGWSWGSRYLIPSYALLSTLLSVSLEKIFSKWFLLLPFFAVATYSIVINCAGAVSGAAVPPTVEAQYMESVFGESQVASPKRAFDRIEAGFVKPYEYQARFSSLVSPSDYFDYIDTILIIAFAAITFSSLVVYKMKLQK